MRICCVLLFLSLATLLQAFDQESATPPSFGYVDAVSHEIKPHLRVLPLQGVMSGFSQLRLNLRISPEGNVVDAEPQGNEETLKFWPLVRPEVFSWKFVPFKKNGKPIIASVEEYIDLVPPERLPKQHVAPPVLRPNSKVVITLERTECFGTCPAYVVTVGTDGIVFEGRQFVAVIGKRTAEVDKSEVIKLAQKFVDADFYSMEDKYMYGATDHPTYHLSITIDGQSKKVVDYIGFRAGMPAIISDLENDVDQLAGTRRWIRK